MLSRTVQHQPTGTTAMRLRTHLMNTISIIILMIVALLFILGLAVILLG
jgi:hypothetical protein